MNAAPEPEDTGNSYILSAEDIAVIASTLESGALPAAAASPSVAWFMGKFVPRFTRPAKEYLNVANALTDMRVPDDILPQIENLFKQSGFTLSDGSVADFYDETKSRTYTSAVKGELEIVILHLPQFIIESSESIGPLVQAVRHVWDRHGRIVSTNQDWAHPGYVEMLQSLSNRTTNVWEFIPWRSLELAINGKMKLDKILKIPAVAVGVQANASSQTPPQTRLNLEDADQRAIIELLSTEQDLNADFFKLLLLQNTDWPKPLKEQITAKLTGAATDQARHVLNVLMIRNQYDAVHERHGDTYLGWMLLRLLPTVGKQPDGVIIKTIVKYRLVAGVSDLASALSILKE